MNSNNNNNSHQSGGGGGGYPLQQSTSSMSLNQSQQQIQGGHQPNQLMGVGRPLNCEDQLILRLPPQLADRVRKMIKQKHIDTPIDLSFKDGRQVQFKFGQEEYNAALLDLPCVLESHKTLDKSSYFKTGDVGQIIQVFDNHDPNNNNNNNNNNEYPTTIEDIPKDFKSTSGITPPTKDIVKKRFIEASKEKVLDIAKIEEEVIRLIKPGYNEQEEAEFVTLEELREQYGTEMFAAGSTETIIFEERADDQVALDEEDSGDDIDHDEDNENGFMTLKIKTKPNAMTRRDIGGFDDDDFDDRPSPPPRRLTHTGPSPGRPSSMSPLDSEKSPSGIINANGDFIPVKKERKTRSDKGKERVPHHLKVANQHLYHGNQPTTPSGAPTSAAPLSSGGGLKIKLPLSSLTGSGAAVATIPPQSPSIGDVHLDTDGFRIPEERRSVMSPGTSTQHSSNSPLSPTIISTTSTTTTTSTTSVGGVGGGGGDEERRKKRKEKEGSSEDRHRHRKERSPSEGGERRKKRRERDHRSSGGDGSGHGHGSGHIDQHEPFSPTDAFTSTSTPSIIVKIPNLHGGISSPPTHQQQHAQVSTPTLQDIQIQIDTPPIMQEVSSPPLQQQQQQYQQQPQPIANIVNTPPPPPLPITPPSFNIETPPLIQTSTSSTTMSSNNNSVAAVDSTTSILQSVSTLRKLQQEADSLKKKIEDAQAASSSILNKIQRDRHQEKIDKMVASYSSLLKEIERLETSISQNKYS
ncbi:transcription initiation factor TFIID subunit [Cavenderia fasciculata]|uniref:Transcription initiation factor TFIID subunit n=1 Tax=Cavenderia fasciculata TaxID=261658 RepID=F4QFM2_CACFS|nr:transcription initiation factor TFIID subunit [Cavenderia fasciculata]EGG13475.1 transcription initiation factor TFIID subunit [Cavenderia fasciculata]|eukprot:XP_004350179.1 transcription initiation factor TFIID subunit [Cavenderia fasciculata]